MIRAVSVFSSAGIGNLLLDEKKIKVVAVNELLKKRTEFYEEHHPKSDIYCGSIQDQEIKESILSYNAEMLIATPPCQGVSSLGKNKSQDTMILDERNFLIFDIFDLIDNSKYNYVLIENVPRYLKMKFPYEGELRILEDILNIKYSEEYEIDCRVLNAKDYNVPQNRERAIIRMWKKGKNWKLPEKQKEITLKEAIGHLPSLESGEASHIRYHHAKVHNAREILAMKHTATGKSAMKNEVYYPKKENGDKIKGFHNTYKRLDWDVPCHARTMSSGTIGSHNNVHPGRKKKDGTYSDARVLTLKELFIVFGLPEEFSYDEKKYSENFIRQILGEAVPPLLMNAVVDGIEE